NVAGVIFRNIRAGVAVERKLFQVDSVWPIDSPKAERNLPRSSVHFELLWAIAQCRQQKRAEFLTGVRERDVGRGHIDTPAVGAARSRKIEDGDAHVAADRRARVWLLPHLLYLKWAEDRRVRIEIIGADLKRHLGVTDERAGSRESRRRNRDHVEIRTDDFYP